MGDVKGISPDDVVALTVFCIVDGKVSITFNGTCVGKVEGDPMAVAELMEKTAGLVRKEVKLREGNDAIK